MHSPPQLQPPIQEEIEIGEEKTKGIAQPQEEEHLKVAKFTAMKEELKSKLATKVDPIAKANMEWELWIIHSANM